MNHLILIGLLKGENVFSCPEYSRELAAELIDHLRDIARTSSSTAEAPSPTTSSAVALMEADSCCGW